MTSFFTELFQVIGLGLALILPLANPITTVALFLGLSRGMSAAEMNREAMMASVYVFAIMFVAFYAGQLVMNTFGISIPGLRIAGGLESPPIKESISRVNPDKLWTTLRRFINGTEALHDGADYRAASPG